MSEQSQANLFENDAATLTPLSEASHVRTSVLREMEQALMASGADFGESSTESFARYDPALSSWRTSQLCLTGEWAEFSETWPSAGTMRNGIAFRRHSLVRRIKEIGCFLLPSPVASLGTAGASYTDNMIFRETRNGIPRKISNRGINGSVGLFRLVRLWTGKIPTAGFVAWMMGFPKRWTRLEDSAMP